MAVDLWKEKKDSAYSALHEHSACCAHSKVAAVVDTPATTGMAQKAKRFTSQKPHAKETVINCLEELSSSSQYSSDKLLEAESFDDLDLDKPAFSGTNKENKRENTQSPEKKCQRNNSEGIESVYDSDEEQVVMAAV